MSFADASDYIQQQLAAGVTADSIGAALLSAGWQVAQVDEAMHAVQPQSQAAQTPISQTTQTIITEHDYPVQFTWVFKTLWAMGIGFSFSLGLLLIGFINYYLILIVIFAPFQFLATIFRRRGFHFSLEQQYMNVSQGVISRQQRHIAYGVIQNVYVQQDIFDRIFHLASLAVENASGGGANGGNVAPQKAFGITLAATKQKGNSIGFSGNKVSIPGLKTEHAEALKGIILERMRLNKTQDGQSGL